MLETLLKLYVMSMAGAVRSPMAHMFGPAGCGKSTFAQQLADLVGKRLFTINVSRISPLELEGVQMPVDGNTRLDLLTATFWTQLKDGDILLLDEFLRGFPEVYNGLLDILTSRQVGAFKLPNVFIIGASNTTVSYDKALEDRLLHILVPDPRHLKSEKTKMAHILIDSLGLLPEMVTSMEMQSVLDTEVLPMFEIMDALSNKVSAGAVTTKGHSLRHLIGSAQMRHVQSDALAELITMNNSRAERAGKPQYVFLLKGKDASPKYVTQAKQLRGNNKLTEIQARNLNLNLQLIDMEAARIETKEAEELDVAEFA